MLDVLHCVLIDSPEALNMMRVRIIYLVKNDLCPYYLLLKIVLDEQIKNECKQKHLNNFIKLVTKFAIKNRYNKTIFFGFFEEVMTPKVSF